MTTLLIWGGFLLTGLVLLLWFCSGSVKKPLTGINVAFPFRLQWADLYRWDGTVDRGVYFTLGVLLGTIKHNLDRLVTTLFFKKEWFIAEYLELLDPNSLAINIQKESGMYLTLLLIAIPFLWTGVVMTLRRLRDVGLPLWLVVFFFVPYLHFFFILLLCILPSRTMVASENAGNKILARILPDNIFGSALMSILLTSVPAMLLVWDSTSRVTESVMNIYTVGLFIGLPFCIGLVAVLLYGYHRPRRFLECLIVSVLAITFVGVLLLAVAIEGILCVAMAAPLGLGGGALGGILGYFLQRRPGKTNGETPMIFLALALSLPLLMGAEAKILPPAPMQAVVSTIEIDAKPQTVWHNVVSFSTLPEPQEWFFQAGIAYPVRAEIQGEGIGAMRRCIFTTGAFMEPIEVWDPPHQLKFGVASQPSPMREWSYREITPAHLNDYLDVQGGQFLLSPAKNGKTLLTGTTWYKNSMWPAPYWSLWSDNIIHQIHMRVLNHIQALSESAPET